jgi:hypothetical protein
MHAAKAASIVRPWPPLASVVVAAAAAVACRPMVISLVISLVISPPIAPRAILYQRCDRP